MSLTTLPTLMTPAEVARRLGTSSDAVEQRVARGQLVARGYTGDGRPLIDPASVERLAEAAERFGGRVPRGWRPEVTD